MVQNQVLPVRIVKSVLQSYSRHRCQLTAIFGYKGCKRTGGVGDMWFWMQRQQQDLRSPSYYKGI